MNKRKTKKQKKLNELREAGTCGLSERERLDESIRKLRQAMCQTAERLHQFRILISGKKEDPAIKVARILAKRRKKYVFKKRHVK